MPRKRTEGSSRRKPDKLSFIEGFKFPKIAQKRGREDMFLTRKSDVSILCVLGKARRWGAGLEREGAGMERKDGANFQGSRGEGGETQGGEPRGKEIGIIADRPPGGETWEPQKTILVRKVYHKRKNLREGSGTPRQEGST